MSAASKEQMLKEFDDDVAKLRECLASGSNESKDMGYSLIVLGPVTTGALFNSNNMVLLLGAMTAELNRQCQQFNMRTVLDALQDKALMAEAAKNPQ